MNEFGEHGPTRDPALGDTASEGMAPEGRDGRQENPEGGQGGSRGTVPDGDRPAESAPAAGREHEQAGTDSVRRALSEHE